MKQRNVHKMSGKKTDEKERFEKWLMEDRIGIKNCRDGSRLQETLIYCNLERAASAPFDTDAKVSVLSSLFMPSQPSKSLLVMQALFEIAKDGSEHAREAFEKVASTWLVEPTLLRLYARIWSRGTILILNAASELDSPELKIAIERTVEREPEAGIQIEFWKKAIPLGCEIL
jgi:hypothetical protein